MSPSPIKIKKPRLPVPGDAVGIVAPASPFDKEKFLQGVSILEGFGFLTVFPDTIFRQSGYLAGSDELRAGVLNAMFEDPEIKAIFCARGGYGTLRILPLIDYELIAGNPKLFIGCSDVTTLLSNFISKSGLACFHGPMVQSMAGASDETIQSLNKILTNHQALTLSPEKPIIIRKGEAKGQVIGGNLTTLCHLVGTPFEPDFSDKIILLEDVGESPYRIDRMLMHLKLAGCLDDIAGMILGSFKGCGEIESVYRIFTNIFSHSLFPIIGGFAIGHDEPNVTVPFGINASLDTAPGRLTFTESPFCL